MMNEKKRNEIRVLAKYLRRELTDIASFKFAVHELFKGEGRFEIDNGGQVVVYTGHMANVVQLGGSAPLVSDSCIELDSHYRDPQYD